MTLMSSNLYKLKEKMIYSVQSVLWCPNIFDLLTLVRESDTGTRGWCYRSWASGDRDMAIYIRLAFNSS